MIELPRYLSAVNWLHVILACGLFAPVLSLPHLIYLRFILHRRTQNLRPLGFPVSEKRVRWLGTVLSALYCGFLIGGVRSSALKSTFDDVTAQIGGGFGDEVAFSYAIVLIGNANYLFTVVLIAVRFGKDLLLFVVMLSLGLVAMFVSSNIAWEVIPRADENPFYIKMAIAHTGGAAAIITLLLVVDFLIAPREANTSEAKTKWRPTLVILFALYLVTVPGIIFTFLGVGQGAAYVIYLITSLPVILVVTFGLFGSESLAGRLLRATFRTGQTQPRDRRVKGPSEPPHSS